MSGSKGHEAATSVPRRRAKRPGVALYSWRGPRVGRVNGTGAGAALSPEPPRASAALDLFDCGGAGHAVRQAALSRTGSWRLVLNARVYALHTASEVRGRLQALPVHVPLALQR